MPSNPEDASRTPPRPPGLFGSAVAATVASFVLAGLGAMASAIFAGGFNVAGSPVFVAWVVAGSFLAALIARPAWGARAGTLTALLALGSLPLFAVALLYRFAQPLVVSTFRCGTGDVGLVVLAPFFLLVAYAVTFVGAYVMVGARRAWIDRGVRLAAYALLVAGAALGIACTLHARGRVEPDAFVASLPVVAELPAVGPVGTDHIASVGGLRLERDVVETVEGTSRTGAPSCSAWLDGQRLEYDVCGALVVRHDATSGFYVFETASRWDAWPTPVTPLFAYDASGARAVDLRIHDVASRLAPPRAWLVDLAVALAFSAGWIAFGARSRRRAAPGDPLDADHEGDGWVRATVGSEGEPQRFHVPQAAVLAPGPIHLVVRGGGPGGYRDLGAPHVVSAGPGTVADAARAAADAWTAHHAVALLATALAIVPLLVAVSLGVGLG